MSGSVDVAIMWEPATMWEPEAFWSSVVDGAHALVTSADYPDTILDSLVVNSDYAKENPDVVALCRGCMRYKAVDFLNENPDKAYEGDGERIRRSNSCRRCQ